MFHSVKTDIEAPIVEFIEEKVDSSMFTSVTLIQGRIPSFSQKG